MTPTECALQAVRSLTFGEATTFENLTMVPILADEERAANYLTLDEALESGVAAITEVSDAGQVSQLKIVVKGHRPVLIVDGEELVGAKQNRVLNLTILVPAGCETVLPVSCVEAGRWRHTSRHFASAPRTQFAEGRAARMRQVNVSMARDGSRTSDQSAVWDLIAMKSSRLDAPSDTAAMSDIYEKLHTPIEGFVGALAAPAAGARHAGAMFFINGQPAGLELFDAPATWRKLSPKIIRSYALDALDADDRAPLNPGGIGSDSFKECSEFAARIASSTASAFPAVGEGDDVRFGAGAVVGGALVARGGVVHVSAFPAAQV